MFYTIIGSIIIFALIKDLIIDVEDEIGNGDLEDYDDEKWDNEDTE